MVDMNLIKETMLLHDENRITTIVLILQFDL